MRTHTSARPARTHALHTNPYSGTPSGPGVRWYLSQDYMVRFTKSMTRVFRVAKGQPTLLTVRLLNDRFRPSDAVLRVLLRKFVTLNEALPGNRRWIIQQRPDRWQVLLEVTSTESGMLTLPLPGQVPGWKADVTALHGFETVVNTYWRVADLLATNPDLFRNVQRARLEDEHSSTSKYIELMTALTATHSQE